MWGGLKSQGPLFTQRLRPKSIYIVIQSVNTVFISIVLISLLLQHTVYMMYISIINMINIHACLMCLAEIHKMDPGYIFPQGPFSI